MKMKFKDKFDKVMRAMAHIIMGGVYILAACVMCAMFLFGGFMLYMALTVTPIIPNPLSGWEMLMGSAICGLFIGACCAIVGYVNDNENGNFWQ